MGHNQNSRLAVGFDYPPLPVEFPDCYFALGTGQIPSLDFDMKRFRAPDAFTLVEASEANTRKIEKQYPVEDITGQFVIHAGEDKIDTSTPRFTSAGKRVTHPAYKGIKMSIGPSIKIRRVNINGLNMKIL